MLKKQINDNTDWENIINSKKVNNENLLTLDYSRMLCILWGTVKELKKIEVLENK